MRYRKAMLGLALVGVLGAGNALGGVTITTEVSHASSPKPEIDKLLVETDRLKMAMSGSTIIYRADLNRMWFVDEGAKSFRETSAETMRQMQAAQSAALEAMRQQMKSMPEAQRKQVEAMLQRQGMGSAQAPPQVTYVKLASGRTVGRWSCELYEQQLNGQKSAELCFARLGDVGVTRDDIKVFKSFAAFLTEGAPPGLAALGSAFDFDQQTRAIGFEGIPVQTVHYLDGKPGSTTTFTAVERTTFPPATFEVPAGYQKQDAMPTPGTGRPPR